MNKIDITESSPHVIRDGIYVATFYKNGEPLFLRMELLTDPEGEMNYIKISALTRI